MPSVDAAMAQSLRPGMWAEISSSVTNAIVRDLSQRDIISDTGEKIDDIQTALSSWDNCMAVDWCKWPLIAIIAVGGLIIFSVAWCIIRCACCGVSCCCSIFKCFKCCGNCCGCCDPPGSKKHKYLDADAPFNHPEQGYRNEAPMHAGFNVAPAPAATPSIFKPAPPQYAEFDVSRKGGEDSLPAMPVWDDANSKKIEVDHDVELEPLKKQPLATVETRPSMDTMRSGHNTPMPADLPSPYGPPQVNANGFANTPGYQSTPYGQNQPYGSNAALLGNHDQPYGSNPNLASNRESVGYGLDQPYDMDTSAPPPMPAGLPDRQSPAPIQPGYGHPMDQTYGQMSNATPYDQGGVVGAYGQAQPPRGPLGNPRRPPPGSRSRSRGPPNGPNVPNGPPGAYGARRQGTGDFTRDQYGPRQQGAGDSSRDPYGPRRQGTSESARDQYGPRRQGTGDSSRDPYGPRRPGQHENSSGRGGPHGMDPRNRRPGQGYAGGDPRHLNQQQPPHQSPASRPGYDHGPGPQQGYQPPMSPGGSMNRSYSPGPITTASQPVVAPTPDRPFAQANAHHASPPASPIRNNSGFDFNSGFSRPSQEAAAAAPAGNGFDRRPSESKENADAEAYPGYKPYGSAQQGWSGI